MVAMQAAPWPWVVVLGVLWVGVLIWAMAVSARNPDGSLPWWMPLIPALVVGLLFGGVLRDPALAAVGRRLIEGLNVWLVLGLVVSCFIPGLARAVTRTLSENPLPRRFEVVRHWGGLGSGEGGWKVELQPESKGLLSLIWHVAALIAVCAVALSLVLIGAPARPQKNDTDATDASAGKADKTKKPQAVAKEAKIAAPEGEP